MEIVRRYIRERISVQDCGHASACWLWTRCRRDGYGRLDLAGRAHQAHRISYEAFVGTIPAGLEIDHLCCVTNCVNPDHLEPVTGQENLRRRAVRRGLNFGKRRLPPKAKTGATPVRPGKGPRTHCKNGHEYSSDNTVIGKRGTRRCVTCHKAELARYARRRREIRAAARKSPGGGGCNGQRLYSHISNGPSQTTALGELL